MRIKIKGGPQGVWPPEEKKKMLNLAVEAELGESRATYGLYRRPAGEKVYLVSREEVIRALQERGDTSAAQYWERQEPLDVLRFSLDDADQIS